MIKFRAWGRNGNYPGTPSEKFEMFYDVSVVTTYKDKEQHVIADFGMYNESEYNGTEIIDYTLMQSTGLFDKNGVKIFDGDIVKLQYTIASDFELFEVRQFRGGMWRIDNRRRGSDLWLRNEDCEVIGNIHENPELLESVEE